MAVGAAAARTGPGRAHREPRTAPRRRPVRSKGVAGGIVWIVFVTVLLAGVVALNVAVLRLNVQLDDLAREKHDLRASNNELASRLAAVEASGRIQALASQRLGLVPAEPDQATYLTLRGR
jgi:cell division protein FtsL